MYEYDVKTSYLPSTKITGTFGESNLTWLLCVNMPVSFLYDSSVSSASQISLSFESFLKFLSSGILSKINYYCY